MTPEAVTGERNDWNGNLYIFIFKCTGKGGQRDSEEMWLTEKALC